MKSARDHYIRLIPVFENYWEAYGGIDKRLAWEGLPGGQAGRWRFFNKQQCPGCFTQYKNYVQYALSRTNFFTGVRWIDDPTVLAWELMNEPRYQDATPNENTTGTTLRAWVDEMGALRQEPRPQPPARYGHGGPAEQRTGTAATPATRSSSFNSRRTSTSPRATCTRPRAGPG